MQFGSSLQVATRTQPPRLGSHDQRLKEDLSKMIKLSQIILLTRHSQQPGEERATTSRIHKRHAAPLSRGKLVEDGHSGHTREQDLFLTSGVQGELDGLCNDLGILVISDNSSKCLRSGLPGGPCNRCSCISAGEPGVSIYQANSRISGIHSMERCSFWFCGRFKSSQDIGSFVATYIDQSTH